VTVGRVLASILLFWAAAAAARPSDGAEVERVIRALDAAMDREDRAAIDRLTWPEGQFAVRGVISGERTTDWYRRPWHGLSFNRPGTVQRSRFSGFRIDVREGLASARVEMADDCLRDGRETGIRSRSTNRIELERRHERWRVVNWYRTVERLGEGAC
jgi:hypothetical protein